MDALAARLARRWGFHPTEDLPPGHCSRVYADADRVLKVPWQGEEATTGWRAALLMSGNLGPLVFEHDPESGALLMERLRPGFKLATAVPEDEDAFPLLIQRMHAMRQFPVDGTMPLAEFYPDPEPLRDELLATTDREGFLHGDLHHENVLHGGPERGWVVIDPKGLRGDLAFEPVAALRNPIEVLAVTPDLEALLRSRLRRVCPPLGLDPGRVLRWLVVDMRADADGRPPEHPWSRLHRAAESLLAESDPNASR